MDITIDGAFPPREDPGACLASYRDGLGLQARSDVGYGRVRWITAGPAGRPGTLLVLG